MTMRTLSTLLLVIAASYAQAQSEKIIINRSEFLAVVENKSLELWLFGIRLQISSDGTIRGSALGRDVSGSWVWEDNYFCRNMVWGDRDIGYNCQSVSMVENKLRFTSDKGLGANAQFTLK